MKTSERQEYILSHILGPNGKPYAAPANTKPDVAARGFTGLNRYGGLIHEEYLPQLTGLRKIDTYTQMRSDGLVEALLTALRLPIIAGTWDVEAGGTSANAKAARDLVEDQLFNRLVWEDQVRGFLTYLQYGFSLMVKRWKIIGGVATLDELLPIHPRTIVQGSKSWTYDERGKITGVWQYGNDGSTFREEWLPSASLMHFTHEGDFDNPEGRGILRSCYKHWWMVDTLYRIWAIGLERGAIGVPVGYYAPGTGTNEGSSASEGDQDTLFAFVRALTSFETSGACFPNGTTLENFSTDCKTAEIKEFVTHHKTEMAKSILAQWLMLGTDGQGGAYALSADTTDLFLLSLQAIAAYIAAKANREIVPAIVGYNLNTDEYPKLTVTVNRVSASSLAAVIRQLTAGTAPVIQPDEALEDYMRERLSLPPRVGPRPEPVAALPAPSNLPPAEKQQQSRRVELRVFADPPQFKEEPQVPGLSELLTEFRGQLNEALGTLQASVWTAVGLPSMELARTFEQPDDAMPKLTKRQEAAVDKAIAKFLEELAGPDQSAEGFADPNVDDALLQSYERLAHGLGVNDMVRQTGAATSRFIPTRDSPEIKAMLENAFERLSKQGTQRIGPYLDDIKAILVQGTIDGENTWVVAKDLSERFEQYSRYEMERLARTELGFAATAGAMDEMQAEGIRQYRWVVSALACSVCSGFQDTVFTVGQGPTPPGDSHPQCGCSVAPEV